MRRAEPHTVETRDIRVGQSSGSVSGLVGDASYRKQRQGEFLAMFFTRKFERIKSNPCSDPG